ncbi:unnamed protein product [Moneuplotes crassus]|uniref:Transmembrane protein n=1 Tax=Euplotes crassus TaxID=5936 RepID=A0AAD1XX52_EUPCR|nr:unnamed protein product [Moneuplotes crassus]
MKGIIILFCTITLVIANVCKNEAQEIGSPLAASFGITGASQTYLFDVLEDHGRSLLYYVGYYKIGAAPHQTIIYKTDYKLSKLKVYSYDIYCKYFALTIKPNGDFIYIMGITVGKIFEIRTSDLVITREFAIDTQMINSLCDMTAKDYLYFSVRLGSVIETCRWDTTSTNVDCFNLGIYRPVNFVPAKGNQLFFATVDPINNQYYLMNYNFSNPSSLIWEKSIACLTPSCTYRKSSSIIDWNDEWIYAMILFDGNFIFHKVNFTDGSQQSNGLFLMDSIYHASYCMREFKTLVAVHINSVSFTNRQRLILIDKESVTILEEYKHINSSPHGVGRLFYQDQDVMFHAGKLHGELFYLARSFNENIDQLSEFECDSHLFTAIISDYQISVPATSPTLISSSKTLTISTSPSISASDITSTINPSFTTYVALWNQDHVEDVQSNSLVQIQFTWACAQSVNYTDISFSLVQTGSNEIPEWVQIDTANQELYLNKTPQLTEPATYYFSLQISFDSEVHYKRFEITVEQCSITNCEICQLGSPNLCETCKTGFEASSDMASCSKVQAMTGVTEAAAALGAASVMMASASSVLSLSSVNSIFSVMNSLQLAIQLPLVPDYFSPKVLAFLSGMGFSMMSFDFLKFKDIPFVIAITEWVSYPQSDEYLNSIGMRSGSSVVNYLSLMAFIMFLALIHFCIIMCNKWVGQSKHTKCRKWLNKLFVFFTFNIYIRVFIQAFAFTTLSIFSEMYAVNLSTWVTKVSFGLCIMFAMCTSVLFILSFIMYVKSFPEVDSQKYWPCTEYFNGVKPTMLSKLYSSIFMLVRLMLISLLIFGRSAGHTTKTTYFYLINIAYCLYLLVVRPLENPQDNIIEIVNQSLFCCLAVPLTWLNTEAAWTPFIEAYYSSILTASPSICAGISFVFLLKSIISYIRKCRSNKSKAQNIFPKKPSVQHKIRHHNEEDRKENQSNHESRIKSSSSISGSNASIMARPCESQHLTRFKRNNSSGV